MKVALKKCAQQASNSRRRGVQNTVHNSYTKSTENLSIFYMVWTGLDGGSMRNLGIVGRKLVSKLWTLVVVIYTPNNKKPRVCGAP